ncbi:hypothetical protein K505DRAFT_377558 [Melanomma pulvis-pyrius CBS 109.77]|uniref:XPA C-terminal domain-containing protein n=1 Tax=Melanomma pulvis-pyrius CBS 109.77 TaxID=1314802 RepID=A0A6A6X2Q3_9PLEO|nr:hypothetical protein K505DRAFT_377558 [Melanomma pulvis-pyrius CBS 109.77]
MPTKTRAKAVQLAEKSNPDAPPTLSLPNEEHLGKKGVKRKRPSSPVAGSEEEKSSVTPPPKKTSWGRAAKTPAQIAKVKADKEKAAKEKAKMAVQRAAIATEKKAAKEKAAAKRLEQKQRKEDWKAWILEHNADGEKFKCDPEAQDTLTQTNCKVYYNVTPDELKTLPYDERFNSHNIKRPSKVFRRTDVQRLAFRKQAILSGVVQNDEEDLLKRGKALFEDKYGTVDTEFEIQKQSEAKKKTHKSE